MLDQTTVIEVIEIGNNIMRICDDIEKLWNQDVLTTDPVEEKWMMI